MCKKTCSLVSILFIIRILIQFILQKFQNFKLILFIKNARMDPLNRGVSFNTIGSYGDHSAIVHYTPTEETNVPIKTDNIYLLDSGGQYLDGTTDVTRTIHLGTPTNFQKEAFTSVLKGHLAIDRASFPSGAPGTFFDAIARQPLWERGLDYGHGTGHGVGAYGGVHEYPPRLATMELSTYSSTGLTENMFTSNGLEEFWKFNPL